MERRGRPGKGSGHADAVAASGASKERLKAILETIGGARTVADACSELGLSRTRFVQLRQQALQGAAAALEPRAPGRPIRSGASDEQAAWRARCAVLEQELEVARLREELALEDLARAGPGEEKGGARVRGARKKKRKGRRRGR